MSISDKRNAQSDNLVQFQNGLITSYITINGKLFVILESGEFGLMQQDKNHYVWFLKLGESKYQSISGEAISSLY